MKDAQLILVETTKLEQRDKRILIELFKIFGLEV